MKDLFKQTNGASNLLLKVLDLQGIELNNISMSGIFNGVEK